MADKLVVRPKRSKGDDDYRIISIRIKEDLVAQLDEIAKKTGRSRNELITTLLQYGLNNVVIDEKEE